MCGRGAGDLILQDKIRMYSVVQSLLVHYLPDTFYTKVVCGYWDYPKSIGPCVPFKSGKGNVNPLGNCKIDWNYGYESNDSSFITAQFGERSEKPIKFDESFAPRDKKKEKKSQEKLIQKSKRTEKS